MGVVNPNIGDVPATTFPGAANTSRSDEFAARCDAQGTGIITAGTVTAAGTLTLTYGAGVVAVEGIQYAYSGSTIAVTTNSGLLDRRDLLIYRVGTGIMILQGTTAVYTPAAANWALTSSGNPPVSPDIVESTDCILCEIYMPYNATTVASAISSTAGFVIDKSNVLGNNAPSRATVQTTTYTALPGDIVLGNATSAGVHGHPSYGGNQYPGHRPEDRRLGERSHRRPSLGDHQRSLVFRRRVAAPVLPLRV